MAIVSSKKMVTFAPKSISFVPSMGVVIIWRIRWCFYKRLLSITRATRELIPCGHVSCNWSDLLTCELPYFTQYALGGLVLGAMCDAAIICFSSLLFFFPNLFALNCCAPNTHFCFAPSISSIWTHAHTRQTNAFVHMYINAPALGGPSISGRAV